MTISTYLVPLSKEHDFVSDKRRNHHVAEMSNVGNSRHNLTACSDLTSNLRCVTHAISSSPASWTYKCVHSIACGWVTATVTCRPINQGTYKVAHQGTSNSHSHREYPRPLTWQPHLGRMPTSNTAKEALAKLRGNPNSNTVNAFITETESIRFLSFCLLTAHRIHRSEREEKQIVKTDCCGKSPSVTHTICDLAQFSAPDGWCHCNLIWEIVSFELPVTVLGLQHMGCSMWTEFKFPRTVESAVLRIACKTQLHTVGHKDRLNKKMRRGRKKIGESNRRQENTSRA